jgi:MFS family permease
VTTGEDTADPDEESTAGDGIWRGRFLAVTVANLTVVALAAFDGLAIVAALPSITEDLGDVSLVPWVITSFLATSAIAGVVAGPIIDAIGVRRTFRATGLWFFLTSLAVAVAPDMRVLVVARALQGVGGGLVISVSLAAVGLTYPARLRPRAFAANSMVWGVMGFGGPVVVALLLFVGSWRLVFLAQLPLTALALVAGWRTLPSTRDRPVGVHLDWTGIGMLTGLVVSSLVAVSQIGVTWWSAGVATAAAGLFGVLTWTRSASAETAIVRRDHLTRYPLRRVHLTAGFVLVAGLAADNYLPLYVQTVRGWSESSAAFSVLFLTVGWTSGAVASSRLLGRWGEPAVIFLGSLLLGPAIGASALSASVGWHAGALFAAFSVIGLSIGLISTGGLTLLQAGSSAEEMGRTNSAHQFVRTVCITYGVAIGGAILLFVVDRRTGDVEAVRSLLAGDGGAVGAGTATAIGDGFVWIHAFSGLAAVACVLSALGLWRESRSRAIGL